MEEGRIEIEDCGERGWDSCGEVARCSSSVMPRPFGVRASGEAVREAGLLWFVPQCGPERGDCGGRKDWGCGEEGMKESHAGGDCAMNPSFLAFIDNRAVGG